MKKLELVPLTLSALALLTLAMPATVAAHPLGNFTINVYNGITVSPEWVHLDRVVDMAELPTVSARREIDVDRDGVLSDGEAAAWATQECPDAPSRLALKVDGQALPLQPNGVGISFPAGQAGLSTLRLVCGYETPQPVRGVPTAVDFVDSSYSGRAGWREIVVQPSGVTLSGAESFSVSPSTRLLAYPGEASAALPQQTDAEFYITASSAVPGPAMPVLEDAAPLGSPAADVVSVATAAVSLPGGISDLPTQLASIIQANDLSPLALILAFAVAALVGAFHAATPGHGKTLMAAYLVGSRGTVRDALGLGMTVTLAHTIGVLVLGAIVLAAGASVPSERLLPALGLASGVIVTVLGVTMLMQRLRSRSSSIRDHSHDHDHDHEHKHEDPDGWHSHGPIRHTHMPAAQQPLRRRNLLALGLVGGLVPSASAILILVGSIAAGRPALGMVLTVAFGIGMATVLVGVGVLLVKARSLAERIPNPSIGRTLAYAPMLTALVFVIVGAVIAVQSGLQLQ